MLFSVKSLLLSVLSAAVVPMAILRIDGFGQPQMLMGRHPADGSVASLDYDPAFFNANFTREPQMPCAQTQFGVNTVWACRTKRSTYDSDLGQTEIINGHVFDWKNIRQFLPPMDDNAFKNFLTPLKLAGPPPGSHHGELRNIAVLNATMQEYAISYPWLHQISADAATDTRKETYDPTIVPSQKFHAAGGVTSYTLAQKDTFAAAVDRLNADPTERIMVVNFANNDHPGGGYKSGSNAQEEDLFRASDLHYSLGQKGGPPFYPINTITSAGGVHTFSTNALYTPETHILRERGTWKFYTQAQAQQYAVSVCSIAAFNFNDPNDGPAYAVTAAGRKTFTAGGLKATLERIHMMFQMADKEGVDTLIVGAFGCGAFRNSEEHIIWAFNHAIHYYHGSIKNIEFAIIGNHNINAFQSGIIALQPSP